MQSYACLTDSFWNSFVVKTKLNFSRKNPKNENGYLRWRQWLRLPLTIINIRSFYEKQNYAYVVLLHRCLEVGDGTTKIVRSHSALGFDDVCRLFFTQPNNYVVSELGREQSNITYGNGRDFNNASSWVMLNYGISMVFDQLGEQKKNHKHLH